VRSGLHCSPLAHRTIGTLAEGTVRASFSYLNTIEDVDYLLQALGETTPTRA
jgi:selenocysteine lyase/cysteine desulfurase